MPEIFFIWGELPSQTIGSFLKAMLEQTSNPQTFTKCLIEHYSIRQSFIK